MGFINDATKASQVHARAPTHVEEKVLEHGETEENANDDVYLELMIDLLGVNLENVEFQVTTKNEAHACFNFFITKFVSRLQEITTIEMEDDEKEIQLNQNHVV